MEMEEHPPGQVKPAKLPTGRCERPLSHLGAWLAYGVNGSTQWWAVVKPTHVAPLDTSVISW